MLLRTGSELNLPARRPAFRTAARLLAVFGLFVSFLFLVYPAFAQTIPRSSFSGPSSPVFADSSALKSAELVFGLFIGVMITASIYLFFIWIVIRDRGQVFLMLLLACLGLNMASTNDQLMELVGVHSSTTLNILHNYSMILSYIFSIFFTLYFLEVEAQTPYLRLPLFLLAGLLVLLLAYTAFDQQPVHFALPTLGTLTLASVLGAGLNSLRLDVKGSLSHIIAFSFFLAGGLALPLFDLGLIDEVETSNRLIYSSFSMAALMFAIVIAGQFAARQEEKEKELALSNERFALAARGSNEGLFDWNKESGEVYFSDQFQKILGRPLEQNPQGLKTWVRQITQADRHVIFSALRRFRDNLNATTINFEYRIKGMDEGWRWLHTKMVATRSPSTGAITRFVGSIGDITARKRSEEALRASEARFRSITEAHPVPVLIAQLDGHQVLYASPGAETLLGMPHGTLISHRLNRFLTIASERNEILEAMANGHEVNLKEVTITRGDGNTMSVALSARRINYQNRAAMVIGLYDLSEKKRAEEQIAKQQEALQQSEKMAALGGLLAGVAHELNNPLSVVAGQATLLIEGAAEERVKMRAEKIFKASDRCSRIVKSFLALARRKPPERKAFDLNGVITASLELLSYQLRNENIEMKLDLAPDLPPVKGDDSQMTQVFTNLALNAAQAMQTWKSVRHLTIRTTHEKGNIVASITDTGPGIPPAIRTRVFEPFFTTKSAQGGTGVGLSLCLNIIESHGGQLQYEETPGGGATFIVRLPSASAADSGQADSHESPAESVGPLNILLVDDEVELAQTLADLLEPDGHRIDLAADGAIALNKLSRNSFDVIISDLRMPVLDGPGLYEKISQSLPQYKNRIIYVTGDTLSVHVQNFLSQTAVPVIEKPYRIADVRHALAELLNESHGKSNISATDSPISTSPPQSSTLPPP